MTTLRFRVDGVVSTALLLSRLRKLTTLSLQDLRSRIKSNEIIMEIIPFTQDWDKNREKLISIAKEIQDGELPLVVSEYYGDTESPVSITMLNNLITHFRQIELETQCNIQLENGEIDDPSQFIPLDEDGSI